MAPSPVNIDDETKRPCQDSIFSWRVNDAVENTFTIDQFWSFLVQGIALLNCGQYAGESMILLAVKNS